MPPTSPPSERPYFDSIPWCSTILSSPGTIVYIPPSRLVKYNPSQTAHDQYFGRTLHTKDTIPHSISCYQPPDSWSTSTSSSSITPTLSTTATSERSIGSGATTGADYIPSSLTFHALAQGVNGFANVAHGGLIASLLDEAMGLLIELNMDVPRAKGGHVVWGMDCFTAGMHVEFKAPVRTPQVVVAEGRILGIETSGEGGKRTGKWKIKMLAEVRDGNERVLADCKGVWVCLPRKGKL